RQYRRSVQQGGQLDCELDLIGRAHDRIAAPVRIADLQLVDPGAGGAAPIDLQITVDLYAPSGCRAGALGDHGAEAVSGDVIEERADGDEHEDYQNSGSDGYPAKNTHILRSQ